MLFVTFFFGSVSCVQSQIAVWALKRMHPFVIGQLQPKMDLIWQTISLSNGEYIKMIILMGMLPTLYPGMPALFPKVVNGLL